MKLAHPLELAWRYVRKPLRLLIADVLSHFELLQVVERRANFASQWRRQGSAGIALHFSCFGLIVRRKTSHEQFSTGIHSLQAHFEIAVRPTCLLVGRP